MAEKHIGSIRRHLYVLAAVVTVSLAGMLGFTLYSDYRNTMEQEQARIATLTQLIAGNAQTLLARNRDRLVRLARRPAMRAMDPTRCDPILGEFRDLFPEFANLTTVDLSGRAPCSGVPQPGGKPVVVAQTEWFKRAMEQKSFVIGKPFIGPITGRLVSVLVEPVWNDQHQLLGFMGLPLDLERFSLKIPEESLPPGTRFGLMAGDGTLIWRNTDPENLIGKNIGNFPGPREILQVRNGHFENTGTDGIQRYNAVTPVDMSDWVAFMTVPTENIRHKVIQSARNNALIGLAALFAVGVLLTFLLRRIEHTEVDLRHARDAAEAASRAKSVFLANMSHELRTPLNAILGFADLMARDPGVPENQRRNLETINRSGHHLLSLINDILEISKIEAGRLTLQATDCDLHELIASVVEAMELRARSDGLALTLQQDAALPRHVHIDAGKLRQVLINLLSNAIKYTPHGSIRLSAGVEQEDDRPQLRIAVSDTGVGIPAADLERIFHPFFQTEAGIRRGEGTGLGLTIARQYAELLGGRLDVQSVEGDGSTFILHLPLEQAAGTEAAPAPRRVLGMAPGQPSWRVLIVEDKADNRRLLTELMTAAGFTVDTADNGVAAIEQFQRQPPDFVWMDMRMPVMDGYEATRRIRALPGGAAVPIVALTASAFEEDRGDILAAGCNAMLRKPVEAERLFEVLARYLTVEFVYASTEQPEAADILPDLTVLDPALRHRLHQAARALDVGAVRGIADEIASTAPELAQALRNEAEQYRFDALLDATAEEAEKDKS